MKQKKKAEEEGYDNTRFLGEMVSFPHRNESDWKAED
jgi:hypothetical protein